MASSKIRDAIGAVKDQTSISLAKVGGSSSISDLEIAVVKATRHGENPPNPSYFAEILNHTCYSRTMVRTCVNIIARRLNRTNNWVVALKSLMLVQRLLSQGGGDYENEIFFGMRRGMRFLNMCGFRDRSGGDYSAFIRTYALYLDEALEFKMQGRLEKGRDYYEQDLGSNPSDAMVVTETPLPEMENQAIFSRAHNLTHLLERFLACRPAGGAKHSRIVVVAIYPILKESFEIYQSITEILGLLVDRFMQMDVADMVRVHEIFCCVSKHYDELYSFYNWCKTVGIMRFPDYPTVEKISQPKLDMMDDFIRQKSSMLHTKKGSSPLKLAYVKEVKTEPIKALVPIEDAFIEETTNEVKQEEKKVQEEGDLLNLYDDETPNTEDLGDKLALALFDVYPAETNLATTAPPWEAFKDSNSGDWETALVQSASHLSNQKPSLPQGLDTLILDGMYQYGTTGYPTSDFFATGSASSVAIGSASLALPAPCSDPFAASFAVAPPAYVQMSDLEKKQSLLLQEQLLWQQYVRDGMHGQAGLAQLQQQNSYQYVQTGYAGVW